MNALQLAPFNESMRLGQGYNSFLQRPCVYGALRVQSPPNQGTGDSGRKPIKSRQTKSPPAPKQVEKPSVPQVVSYSSRVVTKVSDVTRSMNISAGASVKSGSVTVLGNQSAIDETKLSTSDLNVIISVKVVNQTINMDKATKFTKIQGVDEKNFHYVYGDSYISGFIDGGEFHSLVSIRVLDSSHKEEVVASLKERLNGTDPKTFSMKTTSQSFAAELKETETSIFVNWSGGGQIKQPDEQWTLDSIFQAAAGFPSRVAQYPQRCWAILTRYPNNFSFLSEGFKPSIVRNFANVQQYATDLLDDFMGHKANLRIIESVFDDPIEYGVGPGDDPVNVRAQVLVGERTKIKAEMAKIVKVIEALDKGPVSGEEWPPTQSFEPPEVWATRLPVRRATLALASENPEMAPISESIENALDGFNIVWSSNEKERAELAKKLQNPPPAPKKPAAPPKSLPPIIKPKARDGVIKKDLEWLDKREVREKYSAFLLDESGGMPERQITFNDAVDIEKASLSKAWPTKLVLGLVKSGEKNVLGYYKIDYSGTPSGNFERGKSKDLIADAKGKLEFPTLSLKDRITGVAFVLGKDDKGVIYGIKGIDISVKDGERKGLGELAKNDDVVVKCSAPEGFGLKGFYGHGAEEGKPIERIGVIWGL